MPRKASGEPKIRRVEVKQKNGDTYVYERKILYNPEKKYNETLESRLIGKILAGAKEIVPTRPKSRGSDSSGADVSAVRQRTGMMAILDFVGNESGIDRLLYSCADRGTAQKIISLARYIVATNGQPLPLIDVFQATHPLPYEDGLTEDIYHELFLQIGREASLEQKFFLGRCRTLGAHPAIAYDSTTVSTYSKHQIEARYGSRRKGDKGLRQIKFLVLYEAVTCQPIAFRKLPGNISDVVTIKNAIEQLKVLGIMSAELIMDNGYCSAANIARLLLAGFKFVTRIKTSEVWVGQAIDEHLDLLDDPAAMVPFDPDVYAVSVPGMREFERVRVYGSRKKGLQAGDTEPFRRRVYLQLYCNQVVRLEQTRAFDEKLQAIRALLETGTSLEELPKGQQKLAAEYLCINARGQQTKVNFNVEACREAKRRFGFFALLSNNRPDPFDCLRIYRRRTLIELCFEDYKDKTGGKRPRVWSSDALQGRMFVQFVALCYLEFLARRVQMLKDTLGQDNGDKTKSELDAEKKLRVWLENTSLHHVLQWFDTVESTVVSIKQRPRRWNTETTARDRLFLEKLGVKQRFE